MARGRLDPQLRIGAIDGEAALSRVIDVTVGPDGLLYVTQWQTPFVTVFDQGGSVVRTIGRGGSGPGEFTQAGYVGFLGDSLWVSGRSRLASFGLDGELLDHVAFRNGLDDPRLTYGPTRYMAGGVLVAEVSIQSSMIARGEIHRVPILVTTPQGSILDTLASAAVPRNTAEIQLDDYWLYYPVQELGGPGHAFAPDGSALVLLDVMAVSRGQGLLSATWIDPQGDTLATRDEAFPLRPFAQEVRERVVRRLAAQWTEVMPLGEARVRDVATEQIPWPESEPPYTSAIVGTDRRLWLRRESVSDSVLWDVWSPDTGPSLRVWAPADLELKHASASSVWGVRKSSLDVSFLFRYELVPGC